tara:strand:+ start:206 stop:415 length:210 start_codon:yes stop_codon:yes gene_type:complete
MKLIYWYVKNKKDSERDIRERTKKGAVRKIGKHENEFFTPVRVEVDYRDGFDLLKKCLSPERKFWGVIK